MHSCNALVSFDHYDVLRHETVTCRLTGDVRSSSCVPS